jgi:hypothetical protein
MTGSKEEALAKMVESAGMSSHPYMGFAPYYQPDEQEKGLTLEKTDAH